VSPREVLGSIDEEGKRIVNPLKSGGTEAEDEVRLRPTRLADFIGQSELKDHLHVAIEAAKLRGEPVDHLLFSGPPGLGKTTLAGIIAAETGANFRVTSGPAIVKPGDLAGVLTTLSEGDVLFIDEIHRLDKKVEEILYTAMEDFAIDVLIGQGPSARSIRLDLKHFTLIGATTRSGMLTGPLRDRFGMVVRLDYYSAEELAAVASRSAKVLGVACDSGGAAQIGCRSRGTPRIANRLLRRVRDYAAVKEDGVVNDAVAVAALDFCGVDAAGLDKLDRQFLTVLCKQFGGGPVGISTLAASIGEETETVDEVIEPFLLKIGLLARTPRGRVATEATWAHLGLAPGPKATPAVTQAVLL
jgi:Holliday junction DNA helicase RuvB